MVRLGVTDKIVTHLWTVGWSPALSVSGQYGEQKLLQGGYHKDLRPVEMAIPGQLQVLLSSSVTLFLLGSFICQPFALVRAHPM